MLRYPIGPATLELTQGDIVAQNTDAIVNAANEGLAQGGGVCGAIFRAAGAAQLAAACASVGGCPAGQARITPGFALPARHIIHAVGPVYRRTDPEESAHLLASAYRSSLALAEKHDMISVAFPSISTGIYGYPLDEAANVALSAVCDVLATARSLRLVRFVLWGQTSYDVYGGATLALGLAPLLLQGVPMSDTPDSQTVPQPDALTAITAAAEGLLVMSESDHPLTPFTWPGPGPLTPATLLAHLGLPPDTPAETRSLDAFLGPMAAQHDWFDDAQRAAAVHFAALRDLIAARLTDVRVYRLGRIQITAIIVGVDAAGETVGLQTMLIET
jgi:O-acetyl-ADP-ribose deacetylase (regulator of RNase III)